MTRSMTLRKAGTWSWGTPAGEDEALGETGGRRLAPQGVAQGSLAHQEKDHLRVGGADGPGQIEEAGNVAEKLKGADIADHQPVLQAEPFLDLGIGGPGL